MAELIARAKYAVFNVGRATGQRSVHLIPVGSLTSACGAGPGATWKGATAWKYLPDNYIITCEECRKHLPDERKEIT